jgi:hypothetical protein
VQLSPFSRYFVPLRSKYSPQHPVLEHPQSMLCGCGNWCLILRESWYRIFELNLTGRAGHIAEASSNSYIHCIRCHLYNPKNRYCEISCSYSGDGCLLNGCAMYSGRSLKMIAQMIEQQAPPKRR